MEHTVFCIPMWCKYVLLYIIYIYIYSVVNRPCCHTKSWKTVIILHFWLRVSYICLQLIRETERKRMGEKERNIIWRQKLAASLENATSGTRRNFLVLLILCSPYFIKALSYLSFPLSPSLLHRLQQITFWLNIITFYQRSIFLSFRFYYFFFFLVPLEFVIKIIIMVYLYFTNICIAWSQNKVA